MKQITEENWNIDGEKLFGESRRNWRFICPNCGTVQSGQDFLDLGMTVEQTLRYIGFSCIGRFTKEKGCDWTLGGLFQIQKVEVIRSEGTVQQMFEFAKVKVGDK